jgi:RNA polymerase sigma-70 factor, ECF subfamily
MTEIRPDADVLPPDDRAGPPVPAAPRDLGAASRPDARASADASDDARLLLGVRGRDERALDALYDRYSGLVYALALRMVGDRDLAEEVLQDTFLRCWGGAERYDESRGRVAAWLMGVARNRAIDLLRSRQHQARLRERAPLASPDGPGEPSQPDATELVLLRQAVGEALATLTPPQRAAIELAYYGGLSQADVARALDEPLGTIKTRMRDGLRRLRGALRPLVAADDPASGGAP